MPSAPSQAMSPRGWVALEDRYYQRTTQYAELKWELTPALLANGVIAVAPNAGPLAIVPDFGWALSGFALAVYTLSGQLLKQYDRVRERSLTPVRAVALGWSENDLLTVVYDDGGVVRINIGTVQSISPVYHISGDSERAERIFDAVVLQTGDVIARGVTGAVYRLGLENSAVPENFIVAPPGADSESAVRATIIGIGPERSPCGDIETLFLSEGGALFRNNSAENEQVAFGEPISQLSISANGKFLAFVVANTSSVVVSTIDMSSVIARVNLSLELSNSQVDASQEPASIVWVGSDAIAAFYKDTLALVGPRGEVSVLDMDNISSPSELFAVTETDGLRIISSSLLQFIQLVPIPVASVFCNEKEPSYKLLRASGAPMSDFSVSSDGARMDPLARYELISELRNSENLLAAARKCAQVAMLVDDPFEQKALLKATAYAHRFDSVLCNGNGTKTPQSGTSTASSKRKQLRHKLRDEDLVPTAVAGLRVINAARAQNVGVPLTKAQFELLRLAGLVARLSRFGQHSTALKLAAYGDISPAQVLEQWAVAAIGSNKETSDIDLTTRIIDRFESVERYMAKDSHWRGRGRALPYVSAAEAAFALGRSKCADLLLRKEHRPAPKVAMYLKMEREQQAVIAAVASNDPELVLEVLGKILTRKSFRGTAKLLRSLPPAIGNRAVDLFACHLRQIEDYASLRLIFLETGRVREAALVDIIAADQIEDAKERTEALEKTARMIGGGRHRRSCYFEVQAVKHAATVSTSAFEVERKAGLEPGALRSANDSDLLAHAIRDISDPVKRRETLSRLRREIRIPDRRFFWVCLDAMAEIGDFQSVEALSNSAGNGRPPPIGFLAFVDACLKYNQEAEAVKYAYRIPDLRDRARALARCGLGREATNLAVKLRNKQLQEEVAELANLHASALRASATQGQD